MLVLTQQSFYNIENHNIKFIIIEKKNKKKEQ